MRFSVISPVAGLQKFATLTKTHLLLSHVDSPLYWKFYQGLAEDPNQLLILDNGAYERQMNTALLLDRLKILRPACLVMPDIIGGRAEENFNLAVDFLKRYRHELPCELMFMCQFDSTVNNYLVMKNCIKHMIEMFGVRWFGIPRLMAEWGYSRAELCLWIKDQNFEHGINENYVHAMGMRAGDVSELSELAKANCDSVDSSAPVWRGWKGFDIDASKAWIQNGVPCDFDVHPDSLTAVNEQLIWSNLKKVGVNKP